MISKEVARERLKSYYNPNHSADQLARLEALSSSVSTIGQILIQAGPAWKKFQNHITTGKKIRKDSGPEVTMLQPQERQELFAALFPGLRRMWKLPGISSTSFLIRQAINADRFAIPSQRILNRE